MTISSAPYVRLVDTKRNVSRTLSTHLFSVITISLPLLLSVLVLSFRQTLCRWLTSRRITLIFSAFRSKMAVLVSVILPPSGSLDGLAHDTQYCILARITVNYGRI